MRGKIADNKSNNGCNNLALYSTHVSTCNHCFGTKKKEPKGVPGIKKQESLESDARQLSQEPEDLYFSSGRPSILIRQKSDLKKKFNINKQDKLPLSKSCSSTSQPILLKILKQGNRSNLSNKIETTKSYDKGLNIFCQTLSRWPVTNVQMSNNAIISNEIHTPVSCHEMTGEGSSDYENVEDISSLGTSERQPHLDIKNIVPEQTCSLKPVIKEVDTEIIGKSRLFKRDSSIKTTLESFSKVQKYLPDSQIIPSNAKKETDETTKVYNDFIQNFKDMKNQNRFIYKGDLGEGAYGQVLECLDIRRKRMPVAVKMMKHLPRNEGDKNNEIDILQVIHQKDPSQFNHCATLLQWFDIEKRHCLVFKRYGDNIYTFMKNRKFEPLPINLVSQISYQLCYACAFLHDECKIIHCDLKPENIVFTSPIYISKEERGGKPNILPTKLDIKIIDFGNAIPIRRQKYSKVIGTRHYRAVEIILGLMWDEKIDCWSIGCILYELYTGKVLFGAINDIVHLAMIDKIIGPIKRTLTKNSIKADLFLKNGKFNTSALELYDFVDWKPALQLHFKHTCAQSKHFTNIIIRCLKTDPSERPHVREILQSSAFNQVTASLKRKFKLTNSAMKSN